jgi:hypothetical protein
MRGGLPAGQFCTGWTTRNHDMIDYDTFITHDLIAKAQGQLDAARTRLAAVRVDLSAAQARQQAARQARDVAVAAGGSDAHKAAAALRDATTALDVCGQIVAAAENALAQSDADLITARGVAYRPVYVEGVRQRLAAAAKADQARAMLAEAGRDYASATDILNHATNHDCMDVIFDRGHSQPMSDHAAEIARWSQNYHGAWWGGLTPAGAPAGAVAA